MTNSRYDDLQGKSVFITGGGSGIGADFVKAFADQGANVSFVSLTKETAEQLCDDIETSTARRPYYIQCDIRDIPALQSAIVQSSEKMGAIDILINNAARDDRHTVEHLSVDEWDTSLNTNLRPHFFSVQSVLDDMKGRGGAIINVGSNSSLMGLAGYPAYIAAKSAIVGMTKAMARELGARNIRVNALLPGWVLTERQTQLWATPEAVEECLEQQSLKTMTTGQDVADLALFLASRSSQMITGQAIVIDGGRT